MRNKQLKLCAFILFVLGLTGLKAQEALTTTGGESSGSEGFASYSVGQVVYTTNSGMSGMVTQGVQQPFEIFVLTAIEEATGINLAVSVYPNPTADFLTLNVDNFEISNLSYQLYDMNGKLLETKNLDAAKTSIFMRNHVTAIYFLKVIQSSKEVKTFKIVKN